LKIKGTLPARIAPTEETRKREHLKEEAKSRSKIWFWIETVDLEAFRDARVDIAHGGPRTTRKLRDTRTVARH